VAGHNETSARIDTTVPHPARRYNYWLDGKDNFAADRASADEFEAKFPGMRAGVRANRAALGRMTRYLAGEAGIRQFLDIGTGLPTADNTHEVAQRVVPESRVLYVDNDPLVLTHARALLTSSPEGKTDYLQADLRAPATILDSPELRAVLDLSQPVALMLIAVLHFIDDRRQAREIVGQLMDALPAGSYLAVTQFTLDFLPEQEKVLYRQMLDAGRSDVWPADRSEFAALFDGMDLVDPGVALVSRWRPDDDVQDADADPSRIAIYAGLGRKP
jgi:S-adenosyl methyltransferase